MAHLATMFATRPASTSRSSRSVNAKSGHVLIVAAEGLMREFVDSALRQAGYSTVRALNPPEAVGMAEQFGPFDLLVTAEMMESHELARELRQAWPNLKVLYLAGFSDTRSADKVTLRENESFLDKSVTAGALLKAVSILLYGRLPPTDDSREMTDAPLQSDEQHDSHIRILLVEDDVTYARFTQEMLQSVRPASFQLAHTTSVHSAIERLPRAAPDIVLLDLGLPDAQKLEALNALVDAAPNLPIIILSGTENEVLALEAVKAGAQDYLLKGQATPELLVKAIRYGIERKQSELHMKRLAYYDSLTGLPNRRLLMEHLMLALKRVARNDSVVGVFFIDIDHFKQINDTLGHEAGDRVLQQLAEGMSQSLRDSDTLARLSGDEFVAVVEVAQARQLAVVAASLQHRVKTPFTTTDGEAFVTASIGVSAYPTDGDDAEELIRSADRAMYRAKAQGRDTVRFYAAPLETTGSSQVAFKSALRRAIERGELLVHFQPLVDLHTGQVDGLEALVRWRHSSRGVIPPSDFIPLAEESGLILLIERWVLQTAMTEAASHRDTRQLKLAINISRRHFDNPALLRELKSIVRRVGYDACLLELELTESGIMHHPKRVLRHLKECRRLGIRVAVDDFGTGYSCLGLMKRFPLNALKIDRSFVHNCGTDPTNRALVAAIISLGHALGLQVTAEGVETASELEYLRDQNCDRAQGYYFGRPVQSARLKGLFSRSAKNRLSDQMARAVRPYPKVHSPVSVRSPSRCS
jgi:diguanylate cyclase (GGDEF)-like protein